MAPPDNAGAELADEDGEAAADGEMVAVVSVVVLFAAAYDHWSQEKVSI